MIRALLLSKLTENSEKRWDHVIEIRRLRQIHLDTALVLMLAASVLLWANIGTDGFPVYNLETAGKVVDLLFALIILVGIAYTCETLGSHLHQVWDDKRPPK